MEFLTGATYEIGSNGVTLKEKRYTEMSKDLAMTYWRTIIKQLEKEMKRKAEMKLEAM